MIIQVEFNPPVVTVIGGPLSESFYDVAQVALPACCSNTVARRLTRKAIEPTFKEVSANVRRMEIVGQFCEIDTTTVGFFATLLDLVEAEDAWVMVGSLSRIEENGEADKKELYTFQFKRQRPRDEDTPRKAV